MIVLLNDPLPALPACYVGLSAARIAARDQALVSD